MREVDRLDQQWPQWTPPGSQPPQPAPGGPQAAAGSVLVSGRVAAPDGGAVVGGAVTLADLSGRQIAVTRTTAAGEYALTGPGEGTYLVIASAAGRQPSASLVIVRGGPARHDVVLSGGGGLDGTVRVAGSGEPVAGATVTVADSRGEIVGSAQAGDDGTFSLSDLGEGEYTMVVAAGSYRPVALHVALPGGQRITRDVELPATGRVTGSVLSGQSGEPFPGALLSLVDESGQEVASATADADGRFAFDDVAPGPYTVVASGYRPGVTALRASDEVSRQADITLGEPGA